VGEVMAKHDPKHRIAQIVPSAPYQRRCQHVIRFGNDLEPPAAKTGPTNLLPRERCSTKKIPLTLGASATVAR
jgi:hypothetical protein